MRKVFILLLFISSVTFAQPQRPAPTPNDTLQSVRIFAENNVAFSIYAPKASAVSVSGDFSGGYPALQLTKADNGVWSVTIPKLRPDVYTYDFTVDGVKTFDPKIRNTKKEKMDCRIFLKCPVKNLIIVP